jgi:SAM-dependent methyltransferase
VGLTTARGAGPVPGKEGEEGRCLLCGGGESDPFYDRGAPDHRPVFNRICRSCGLVFQHPRPDFEALGTYYRRYLADTQPERAGVTAGLEDHVLAIARLRLSFLRESLRPGDRVLDVGCSFGGLLKVLRDESGIPLELTGVNPEPEVAAFGRREYGLTILEGMFEEVPLPAASFDLVILDNVLEHVADPAGAVARIHALLAPGGRLFVATNDVAQPHGYPWMGFFPDHVATFSPATLRLLLERGGFTLERSDLGGHVTWEGYRYPYQYALGRKAEEPAAAGRLPADPPGERRRLFEEYRRRFYREAGPGAGITEAVLDSGSPLLRRLWTRWGALAGRLRGTPPPWVVRNHTLPPAAYRWRRYVLAECRTAEDRELARRLVRAAGMEGELFLLRETLTGALEPVALPREFRGVRRPRRFADAAAVTRWLEETLPRPREVVRLTLRRADLPDGALLASWRRFRRSGRESARVSFARFTGAEWTFRRLPAGEATAAGGEGTPLSLWPGRTEVAFYCREGFGRHFAAPSCVALDLSPFCNKACDKCQFHSPRSPFAAAIGRGEMMDPALAESVLEEAARWEPKPVFAPTYSGEPLLYPHLERVLRRARDLGLRVSLTTNGLLLDREAARLLVGLGVENVTVSLDAHREETYRLLQAPGSLERVRENVLGLLAARGGRRTPTVGIHFVMEERNREEFAPLLAFWGPRVDSVSRAILQDQFRSNQLVLPPWLPLGPRQACWAPFTTLYVRHHGGISFCGYDLEGNRSGLSVRGMSLREIWTAEPLERWRRAQLENDRTLLYCRACPDWAVQNTVTGDRDGYRVVRSPFTEQYFPLRPGADSGAGRAARRVREALESSGMVPPRVVGFLADLYRRAGGR